MDFDSMIEKAQSSGGDGMEETKLTRKQIEFLMWAGRCCFGLLERRQLVHELLTWADKIPGVLVYEKPETLEELTLSEGTRIISSLIKELRERDGYFSDEGVEEVDWSGYRPSDDYRK